MQGNLPTQDQQTGHDDLMPYYRCYSQLPLSLAHEALRKEEAQTGMPYVQLALQACKYVLNLARLSCVLAFRTLLLVRLNLIASS